MEEGGEAGVEDLEVFGAGDAVAFVLEGEEFVGDVMVVQGFCDGLDVVGCNVGVLEALDDQEFAADVFYVLYRGSFAVYVRDV